MISCPGSMQFEAEAICWKEGPYDFPPPILVFSFKI